MERFPPGECEEKARPPSMTSRYDHVLSMTFLSSSRPRHVRAVIVGIVMEWTNGSHRYKRRNLYVCGELTCKISSGYPPSLLCRQPTCHYRAAIQSWSAQAGPGRKGMLDITRDINSRNRKVGTRSLLKPSDNTDRVHQLFILSATCVV
jgi:hypothetical protein